jgi:hypothetical protein
LFQFLINDTIQGNPTTGEMKWLPNGLRGGTLGIRNWFLPRGQASNGTILFSSTPSIATLGYCGLNVCTIPDPSAYQWSASDMAPRVFGWTMPNQDHNRVLKIGMASLMTFPMAKQWYSAVQWAVQVANAEILSFYQLKLDLVALSPAPVQSVRTLEEYKIRSDPVAVMGPLFSFTAKAVASTLQASAIPMVSPAATDEALSNNYYYENGGCEINTPNDASVSMVRVCCSELLDDNPAMDEFARNLPRDMRIVARAAFPLYGMGELNQRAISEALEKIRSSETRIIVYSAHPTSLQTVLTLAKERNMFGVSSTYIWIFDKQVRYMSLTPNDADALSPLTLEDFQGAFMVAPRQRPSGNMLPSDCFPKLQKFLAPSPTANASSVSPQFLTAHWVDAVYLVARSIESLYRKYGDRARDGTLLNEEMRKVAFVGCTGDVALNEYGNRLNGAETMYSFNGSSWGSVMVHYNESDTLEIRVPLDSVLFGPKFKSGTIPLDRFGMQQSEGIGLAIVLITALFQLILVGSLLIVIRYRRDLLIHASSPLFLSFILMGIIMVITANYIWLGDQTMGSCIAQKYLLYLGFALAFGSLLVKNWRIYSLFNDQSMQIIKITNAQLVGYVAAIVSAFLILLILWAAIDPPRPSPSHISGFWCASQSPSWEIIINIMALVGLLAGAMMAILTRKIPHLYNEARFIGLACYNLIVILVGGGFLAYFIQPAIGAAGGSIIASFVLIISFGAVFALLFVPKFCAYFYLLAP